MIERETMKRLCDDKESEMRKKWKIVKMKENRRKRKGREKFGWKIVKERVIVMRKNRIK